MLPLRPYSAHGLDTVSLQCDQGGKGHLGTAGVLVACAFS